MIKIPATSMQATFRSVTQNTYAYDDKTTTETGRHNTTRHKTKRYDTTIQSNTTARRHCLFDDIYKWRDNRLNRDTNKTHFTVRASWKKISMHIFCSLSAVLHYSYGVIFHPLLFNFDSKSHNLHNKRLRKAWKRHYINIFNTYN